MTINYDSITADLITLATNVRAFSTALNTLGSEWGSQKPDVESITTELGGVTSKISDYSVEAAAAAAEKNSLINSVLAIQEEVDFPGPPETRESLEAYYE